MYIYVYGQRSETIRSKSGKDKDQEDLATARIKKLIDIREIGNLKGHSGIEGHRR